MIDNENLTKTTRGNNNVFNFGTSYAQNLNTFIVGIQEYFESTKV